MQNHVIFGAGLIGCYLGACIRHQGISVDLICREKIVDKLQQGLMITDYLNHQTQVSGFTFDQSFTKQAREIDVVWLTVKCTDVEHAVDSLRDIVSDHTLIICCQNGLGSDSPVKEMLPNNQVIKAMVPFNVAELKAGHLHRGSEGDFTIERHDGVSRLVDDLVSQLNSELLPVTACDDMPSLLWAKLQLNLGNSINALADIPVKEMLQQRPYRLVIAAMMNELLQVAEKKNIALPKVTSIPCHWIPKVLSLPTWLFKVLANKMLAIDPNVRTSMWWDVSQGKKTEIDHLNGAIVKQGELVGVDCPVNSAVIHLIKLTEQGTISAQERSISGETLYQSVIQHKT